MRFISCKLEDLRRMVLPIGYEGENDHTRVQVDAGEVFKEYPAAVPTLKVHGPTGAIYPAEVTRDGKNVIWDIKASDCAADGSGEAQFTFTLNNVIVKSCIAKIKVYRSIVGGSTPPDPVQDWIDDAEEVLDDLAAMDNIAKTAEAGDVGKALSPKTVVDGVVTEWQYVEPGAGTEDYTDLENKPQIGGVTLSGDKSLHDLGIAAESAIPDVSGKANLSVVAPAFDQATANDAGSLVTYTDGVVYVLPEGHTAGTTWANTQKTATNIAEQQRQLLNDIQGKPDNKDSDATGVDLDITDPSGNVIVRLKNGHVQTKNFDSSHMTETMFDDAENTDLDITDESGHVLARFSDGHFKTKNFDSRDVVDLENVIFPEKGTSVTVDNVTDLLDEIENGTTDIIYLENGTYNVLNVEVNRKVQIIGKSRTRVLLVSDGTEDQEHDVTAKHGIRFNYGGALKNLTFSANDVKYIMHQDEIYREYDLVVENCTLKRYDDSCSYYFFIGCGSLGKQKITVKDCSFIFSPNTNNRTSYGVYWHNWHLAKNALCAYTANLIIDSCDCVGCGIVIAQDLSDKTVNDFISVLNTYSTENAPVSSGANGTYISVTSENVPYNIVFIINCKIGNMRLQDRDQDEYDYLGAVVTNFVS